MSIISFIIELIVLSGALYLSFKFWEKQGAYKQCLAMESQVYKEALRVFYDWRKEIWGVALKGVGQHYEKWIQWKLMEQASQVRKANSHAHYKT